MPVVAMWKCDRDNSMFENKKDADAHDKMLELAENFTALLQRESDSLSDDDAEALGLLLSRNKHLIAAACKGKAEALLEIGQEGSEADESNVTKLAAKS